jgi:hypothetical protein
MMIIKKLQSYYRSRLLLISFMQDVITQYGQNIKRSTGGTYSMRLRRMTSSIWNDIRLTCALIVATMLTMLYVVVNFLLIILETMAMLMMTLRNTLRSNQQSTTKT